jgi:hypothetical protein
MPFDIEMTLDNLLESLRRVLDLPDHSISHVSKSDDVGIGFVLAFSLFSALLTLKSRLIEVYIVTHGDTLS